MSGDVYHGKVVNMHGGQGNTGMINYGSDPVGSTPPDPALEQAVRELVALLTDLRACVAPATAQHIDASLPAITADPAVPPEERHSALLTVAGIAATAGALGQPVLDAARALIELIAA
ncbi:hypothetical protein F0344_15700 [Streptomyces finlayi]|uniref:Uncharacterized protein n=1 Tax=Streptomyces finlayi TaxID=67296 RepID=A0A7G7BKM1_9ACTN|nr:hypothetical protein [Streptomyces finlayi]QNE75886.1 hypothetical protein F0344_15700 [Streptomyces finlayi]